tara:strand:- start:220 stop:486 length:267 start_codon:yes stop_codon:yes gene_type:complete
MDQYSERTFIFSSSIFSDFSLKISLYQVSTIDDIIKIAKDKLMTLFNDHNLTNLAKILEEKNLHIHSYTIEQILTSKKEDVFYICDHG